MLPATLLALLFASPALATSTSNNDPLRALALRATPKPTPLPVCCLKPLDPQEDDVLLLSFEEWKAKQLQNAQAEARVNGGDAGNHSQQAGGSGGEGKATGGGWDGRELGVVPVDSSSSSPEASGVPIEELMPHFRVPITDRFNYASTDCSARVHASHRTAKSSSSILTSKRDKYMLSPCGEKRQFVIVELCEDIRIDTVQLANFEFFSGVFKEFSVSVAKTYTSDGDGWVDAGRFVAKNARGVQSFHPPPSLRDFYRYLRIDFHSHYGNEYYCPVSLLRVYGLTHLEEWKWEVWEAESKAKKQGNSIVISRTAEAIVVQPSTEASAVDVPSSTPQVQPAVSVSSLPASQSPAASASDTSPSTSVNGAANVVKSTESSMPETAPSAIPVSSSNSPMASSAPVVFQSAFESASTINQSDSTNHASDSSSTSQAPSQSEPSQASAVIPLSSDATASASPYPAAENPNEQSIGEEPSSAPGPVQSPSKSSSPPTQASSQTVQLNNSSSQVQPSLSPSPVATASPSPSVPPSQPHQANPNSMNLNPSGGESIYRTIMNRLTALEVNHTLYTRYVEEQIGGVREVLRRLTEDVGRLEGIGKGQAQMYLRSMREWESHKDRLDHQYEELLHRVNYLADEVVLEKRLGIAQLCLLIAVLVFMGLTRGSRAGELVIQPMLSHNSASRGSIREWSRRQLNLSGDWVSRLGRNRSRRRSLVDLTEPSKEKRSRSLRSEDSGPTGAGDYKVAFPSKGAAQLREEARARSRTPSLRRTPASRIAAQQHHWGTPATTRSGAVRPLVYRANSLGDRRQVAAAVAAVRAGVGIQPSGSWAGGLAASEKSAKRWARSAHLHLHAGRGGGQAWVGDARDMETSGRGENGQAGDAESEDVFASPSPSSRQDFVIQSIFKRHGAGASATANGSSPQQESVGHSAEESDMWIDTDADSDSAEEDLGDVAIESDRGWPLMNR
ncbi:hypothetical protein HGRIS_013737 [Hohenbuehelia grisea]|uniref:SUN domain-containing protein n=1 Tax=Hohenbuehelia grisea TaxID=104357 RepID=A0ABR3IWG8_9AGAR